ncbi:hypothetical protein K493DRAFT_315606 [Basidiobolus meristosporus CBS 931.73]|uniref:RNI-like protein n=1 Tax=Basidiobolus meristosporus CBS 931.73 TaxID=1314790 RepID=A0A1Y1Y8X9_9FUNG|nr:hypothetical protein K493DRAFT_315606 [Basidiobolus meristosporus CBS 931.73]|eukprot:ORX94186.1 hypothetical protein K493DRAFT_315606 [Basidiobolus meristosporus CBS 931.73]
MPQYEDTHLNDTTLTLLFKYLEKAHLPTLHSCLLVNRKWYELAKPLLWNAPRFTTRRECEQFRSIIEENKELASLVTALDLTEYKSCVVAELSESLVYLDSLISFRTSADMSVPIDTIIQDGIANNLANIKEFRYLKVQLGSEHILKLVQLLNSAKTIESLGVVIEAEDVDLSSLHLLENLPNLDKLRDFSLVGECIPEEVICSFIKRVPNAESITVKSATKIAFIPSLQYTLPDSVKYLELGKIADSPELLVEFFKQRESFKFQKFHLELDKSCVLSPGQVIDILNTQSDQLQDLLISGIDLRKEFVTAELKELPALRKVTFRRLANYDPPPIEFWEVALKNFGGQLTHLHIEDGMLPDGLGDLIGACCTQLVEFSAHNTTLDTASVTQLVKRIGKDLRILNLSQTEINEYGINSVLTFCKALEVLDLSLIYGSPYLDPMVFAGVFLRRQGGRLRELKVDGLPINNMLFQMLAKTSTESLEVLSFTENQCISDNEVKDFLEKCRRLRTVHIAENPDGHVSLTRELVRYVDNLFV